MKGQKGNSGANEQKESSSGFSKSKFELKFVSYKTESRIELNLNCGHFQKKQPLTAILLIILFPMDLPVKTRRKKVKSGKYQFQAQGKRIMLLICTILVSLSYGKTAIPVFLFSGQSNMDEFGLGFRSIFRSEKDH